MPVHLLRYDDYSAQSSSAVEEGLADLLLRYRVPCTFSVIPFVADSNDLLAGLPVKAVPISRSRADLLQPLIKAGLAEIALHGFSHLSLSSIKELAEFSDAMPVPVQRRLIQQGRKHLEDVFGQPVRLFVPPWNRMGITTARALTEEGMPLYSAGLHLPWPKPLSEQEDWARTLRQMPCDLSLSATKRALLAASWFGRQSSVVGTLIHDYDFVESGHRIGGWSFSSFEGLLRDWNTVASVSRSLITKAIEDHESNHWERFHANERFRSVICGSSIRERILSRLRLVYWDTYTVCRLSKWAALLP